MHSSTARNHTRPVSAPGRLSPPPSQLLELLEEPKIVLNQHPNVRNRVLPHRDPIDSEAKSPAAVFLAVQAMPLQHFQHVRMHHPAPAQLDPLVLVREPNVHLSRGFGEREEAGPKANLCVRPEI